MSDAVIRVRNVKKDFHLPRERGSDSLKGKIVGVFKKRDRSLEIQRALRGVSFEVERGDFFGIVGRNGSGKSTLLKMLAGIYRPTSGGIATTGKIVPFIELGVGFNPELSGRDNVYLNGALLGFSRAEIDEFYDDIVDFAELHDFMEQKLKNYSSGMQVRLAFSVATRAKADILILDEVLAVGDEAFQRKCNAYFKKIKKDRSVTVVFVTHSMQAVRDFCNKAILIKDGKIVASGVPEDIANKYTEENFAPSKVVEKGEDGRELGLSERVPHIRVVPVSKITLQSGEDCVFDVEYEIIDDVPVRVFVAVLDESRNNAGLIRSGSEIISGKGRHKVRYVFPTGDLNDARLYIHAAVDEVDGGGKAVARLASANERRACRFAVRRKTKKDEEMGALISSESKLYGKWEKI